MNVKYKTLIEQLQFHSESQNNMQNGKKSGSRVHEKKKQEFGASACIDFRDVGEKESRFLQQICSLNNDTIQTYIVFT